MAKRIRDGVHMWIQDPDDELKGTTEKWKMRYCNGMVPHSIAVNGSGWPEKNNGMELIIPVSVLKAFLRKHRI